METKLMIIDLLLFFLVLILITSIITDNYSESFLEEQEINQTMNYAQLQNGKYIAQIEVVPVEETTRRRLE